MKLVNIIDYLRDNIKTLKLVLYILMAATIIFDIFIPRHEAHFFGDKIPGFWSVFGLVCCVLLIRVMKGLSHAVLMKKEDYYD
jgi:hypothetical protein